jgi:hypothetical protein
VTGLAVPEGTRDGGHTVNIHLRHVFAELGVPPGVALAAVVNR